MRKQVEMKSNLIKKQKFGREMAKICKYNFFGEQRYIYKEFYLMLKPAL